MHKSFYSLTKLNKETGAINRVIAVLLGLIAVMVVLIAIPFREQFRYRSECIACEQAMKSAGDGLIIEYLNRMKESSTIEARDTIARVMPGRDNICPTGGNIYLIKDEDGIYQPVCGLHDEDKALMTRLNASYALDALKETRANTLTEREANAIEITVNNKPLACTHVTEEEMIHRGTKTTNGYKGVVAFYGTADDFTFSAKVANKGFGSAKGRDICYFVYADENYCAIWRSNDGWSGDAYDSE